MTHQEELNQLELTKLKAEIAKAIAEKREIEERLNAPWYRRPQFIQAIAAGLVAIPLIWFYFQEVALPSLTAEELEQQIETLKARRDLNATIDTLRGDLTNAQAQNKSTVDALETARQEIEQLRQQLAEVSEQSRQLAAQQADPDNQRQLEATAAQAEAVAETLEVDVLAQIEAEQTTAEARSEELEGQLERLNQQDIGEGGVPETE
ncbi:MAG: hypothetical protein AAF215_16015 [Cyanobacteria bacterium P01_A01_bin.123]